LATAYPSFKEEQRLYLEQLGKKLEINEPDDWIKITNDDLKAANSTFNVTTLRRGTNFITIIDSNYYKSFGGAISKSTLDAGNKRKIAQSFLDRFV
jgi:hypothetical protein